MNLALQNNKNLSLSGLNSASTVSLAGQREINDLKDLVRTCAYCGVEVHSQDDIEAQTRELSQMKPDEFFVELKKIKPDLPAVHALVVDFILATPQKVDNSTKQYLNETWVGLHNHDQTLKSKIQLAKEFVGNAQKIKSYDAKLIYLEGIQRETESQNLNNTLIVDILTDKSVPNEQKLKAFISYLSKNEDNIDFYEFFVQNPQVEDYIEEYHFLQKSTNIAIQRIDHLQRSLAENPDNKVFKRKQSRLKKDIARIEKHLNARARTLKQTLIPGFIESLSVQIVESEGQINIVNSEIGLINEKKSALKAEQINITKSKEFSVPEKSLLLPETAHQLVKSFTTQLQTVEAKLANEPVSEEEALKRAMERISDTRNEIDSQISFMHQKQRMVTQLQRLFSSQRSVNKDLSDQNSECRKYLKTRKKLTLIKSFATSQYMSERNKIDKITKVFMDQKKSDFVKGFFAIHPQYYPSVLLLDELKSKQEQLDADETKHNQLTNGYQRYVKDLSAMPELSQKRIELHRQYTKYHHFIRSVGKVSSKLTPEQKLELRLEKSRRFIEQNPEYLSYELKSQKDYETFMDVMRTKKSQLKRDRAENVAKINRLETSVYKKMTHQQNENNKTKLLEITRKKDSINSEIQVTIRTLGRKFCDDVKFYSIELMQEYNQNIASIRNDIKSERSNKKNIDEQIQSLIYSHVFSETEREILTSSETREALKTLEAEKSHLQNIFAEFSLKKDTKSTIKDCQAKILDLSKKIDANNKQVKTLKILASQVAPTFSSDKESFLRLNKILADPDNRDLVGNFREDIPDTYEAMLEVLNHISAIESLEYRIAEQEKTKKGYLQYQEQKFKLPELEKQYKQAFEGYATYNSLIKGLVKPKGKLSLKLKIAKGFTVKHPTFEFDSLKTQEDLNVFIEKVRLQRNRCLTSKNSIQSEIDDILSSPFASVTEDDYNNLPIELKSDKEALAQLKSKYHASLSTFFIEDRPQMHCYFSERAEFLRECSDGFIKERKEVRSRIKKLKSKGINKFRNASGPDVYAGWLRSEQDELQEIKASLNVDALRARYNTIKSEQGMDIVAKTIKASKQKQKNGHALSSIEEYIVNYDSICPEKLLHAILNTRLKTFDHIQQDSKGGETGLENAFISCADCNMTRSDEELEAFLGEEISRLEALNEYIKKYSDLVILNKPYIRSVLDRMSPKIREVLDNKIAETGWCSEFK